MKDEVVTPFHICLAQSVKQSRDELLQEMARSQRARSVILEALKATSREIASIEREIEERTSTIDILMSGRGGIVDSTATSIDDKLRDNERLIADINDALEDVGEVTPAHGRNNPENPQKSEKIVRYGIDKPTMSDLCKRLFRTSGFTVNEFIARAHWEDTSGRREGARALLQALVADGVAGRSSRCVPGYKTEVEYQILETPVVRVTDTTILSRLNEEVRAAVSKAVDAGWVPEPYGTSARFVRFRSPKTDKHFTVLVDPKHDNWRNRLSKQMRHAGAPV